MKTMRLTDKHPLMAKIRKVESLMDDEGISITWTRAGTIVVSSVDFPNQSFEMKDIEGEEMATFPPPCEYNVVVNMEKE